MSWLINWTCLSIGHSTTSQTWDQIRLFHPYFLFHFDFMWYWLLFTAITENSIMKMWCHWKKCSAKQCWNCWVWCGGLLFLLKFKNIPEGSREFLIEYILRTTNWRILSRRFIRPACVLKKAPWLVDWLELKVALGGMNSEALAVGKVRW